MNAVSRREALRGSSISVIAAGLPPIPFGSAASPDRDLINVCCKLKTVEVEIARLLTGRKTIADEERVRPEMAELLDRRTGLEDRLTDGPQTLAGARAMASALIARWHLIDRDGGSYAPDPDEFLAISIAEFLAGMPGADA